MNSPTHLHYDSQAKTLSLIWPNSRYELSAEFLRVHSPSAEVRGHGQSTPKLEFGKADIGILNIEPSGHYAIKIHFEDGHDTGLYTWDYLYELCQQQDSLWKTYLQSLEAKGLSRQAPFIQSKSL